MIYSLRVYFGDKELQVLSWEKENIKTELPIPASTDSLRVVLFAQELELSLESEGPILEIELPRVNDEFYYLQD